MTLLGGFISATAFNLSLPGRIPSGVSLNPKY